MKRNNFSRWQQKSGVGILYTLTNRAPIDRPQLPEMAQLCPRCDTVLSYFSQTNGADFGDWLSNPIPAGFSPQVQVAFATGGTNPALGPDEITAFNAIGYDVVPSPLIGFGFPTFLAVGGLLFGAKLLQRPRRGIGLFDVA